MKKETNKSMKDLREKLAELEHDQWMSWTKHILWEWDNWEGDILSFINYLREKWQKNWKPYKY